MNIPTSDVLKKQIMITIDVAWRNGLELSVIERWLDNFTGQALGNDEEEKNLALWLLYNFTFFNEEEVKHLCKLLLRKYLHETINNEEVDLKEINTQLSNTYFLPLGSSSESGAYVLYLFRQENDLPIRFFREGQAFKDNQHIVFLDDMTLSGSQALRKIRNIKYAGYNIEEDDISDEFILLLNSKEPDSLSSYIKNKMNCDKKNKNAVAETVNERIIKRKSFYEETNSYFDENLFDSYLKNIIKIYQDNQSNMDDVVIYKMNRLLLENYYKDKIQKGINNIENENYYLLTFIASKKAKEKLAEERIEVINCIEIDESAEAFSDMSMAFGDYKSEKERCKQMCEYYGKKIKPKYPLGFKACQYLFGLYYTIPNNTLPIFWADEDWSPLFIRHEKNYGGKVEDVFGKYI